MDTYIMYVDSNSVYYFLFLIMGESTSLVTVSRGVGRTC